MVSTSRPLSPSARYCSAVCCRDIQSSTFASHQAVEPPLSCLVGWYVVSPTCLLRARSDCWCAGQSRAAAAPRPWVSEELQQPGVLEHSLSRLWFDTHVHDDAAFQLLKQHVGTDHLVYGTNFSGWDQEQGLLEPPNTDGVDLVGNACRLLRL